MRISVKKVNKFYFLACFACANCALSCVVGLESSIFSAFPAKLKYDCKVSTETQKVPLTWPVFYAEKKAKFNELVEHEKSMARANVPHVQSSYGKANFMSLL